MTNLYIESEGDIEYGIQHCLDLAKLKGIKFVTLAFPSKLMYNVFIENLYFNLACMDELPDNVGIEATVVLPPWEDDDDKCIGGG